mmetsp:Transcript_79629/g.131714  ORF Transcript_79629/g.131714 Transcript_79629/m.131714 type:complete len:89 (+) Transcript_79629:889-1155(+)
MSCEKVQAAPFWHLPPLRKNLHSTVGRPRRPATEGGIICAASRSAPSPPPATSAATVRDVLIVGSGMAPPTPRVGALAAAGSAEAEAG